MSNASRTKGLEKKLKELFVDSVADINPVYIDDDGALILESQRGENKYYIYLSKDLRVGVNILNYSSGAYKGTYVYITNYQAHPLELLIFGLSLERYTKDETIELQFKSNAYLLTDVWNKK